MNSTAIKGFRKLCLYTLVAVYFLIGVGAIVRSTGSGMGCPDWPKCFGSLVPPTSVTQLPADYKKSYSEYRDKKNKKFAKYLRFIGLNATAEKILNDPTIREEADFNPTKTWIEYFNRLVGVTIGFFIVTLFAYSFRFRKTHPNFFGLSFSLLLLVLFQGWFGSIVVSTNLTTWTITIHMFLALVMVVLLVYLYALTDQKPAASECGGEVKFLLVASMLILLIQIFLGTRVREGIDRAVSALLPRSEWVSSVGFDFAVHRTFSWVVLILNALLVMKLMKIGSGKALIRAVILLILATLLTGVVMAYFSIPAFLQPLHLLIATLTFGLLLVLYFRLNSPQKILLSKRV